MWFQVSQVCWGLAVGFFPVPVTSKEMYCPVVFSVGGLIGNPCVQQLMLIMIIALRWTVSTRKCSFS